MERGGSALPRQSLKMELATKFHKFGLPPLYVPTKSHENGVCIVYIAMIVSMYYVNTVCSLFYINVIEYMSFEPILCTALL